MPPEYALRVSIAPLSAATWQRWRSWRKTVGWYAVVLHTTRDLANSDAAEVRVSTGGEILIGLAMAIGLVGVVLPVVPGLLLIAVMAVVWAVAEGSASAAVVAAVMIAVLAAGTYIKYRIPGRELAAQGVSTATWILVGVGGVIGFFVIPVIGAFAGVVAGAYIGERIRLGSHSPAWASTKRVIVSIGKGMALEFAAGTVAIAIWLGAVLAT